jgi:hypothetical protein
VNGFNIFGDYILYISLFSMFLYIVYTKNKFRKDLLIDLKITSTEKKYTILQTIFKENNIVCLFGDDEDYFETFDLWFNNSL